MVGVEQSQSPIADPVVVYHGDEPEGLPQPEGFQCCPGGVRIVNRRPMSLYEPVDFLLEFPARTAPPDRYDCLGVIAACRHDPRHDLYHITVRFLDLPEPARRRLAGLTPRDHHLSCPFCENS